MIQLQYAYKLISKFLAIYLQYAYKFISKFFWNMFTIPLQV